MAKRFVTPEEFAGLSRLGSIEDVGFRLASSGEPVIDSDRIIRYRFSDSSVGRDGFTIAQDGWELGPYLANRVFLWAHDDTAPPIGRTVDLGLVGGNLAGAVEYASPDLYPFADLIFRLVKAGYLSAVSTRWLPRSWKYSTDKSRPGGVDFTRAELLEVSQVPVPGLATALVEARGRGIDTAPMVEWAERILDGGGMIMVPRTELEELRRAAKMPKPGSQTRAAAAKWQCAAARDLSIDDKDGWDGPAAEARIFTWAGFDGEKPDPDKAKRAFLAYDSANGALKGSYKEPFADIVDGELKAVAGGIRAAASRLPQSDIPKDVEDEARKVLDAYEAKMKDKAQAAPARMKIGKRGLYEVGWLAYLLADLGCLEDWVEWEAALEEDGSLVPQQLADALKALGQVLIAMTAEEVAEMLSDEDSGGGDDIEIGEDAAVLMAAPNGIRKRALAIAGSMLAHHAAGRKVIVSVAGEEAFASFGRAGRVLSAANEKTLRDAHVAISRGCDMVRSVFEQADADTESGDDAVAQAARQGRVRRVQLLRHEADRLLLDPAAD